ncbi:MAG: hypothetical protein IT422_07150 [Pirellulaceae bacterium]|nr:hypothetical protein [Pirellulaceae bacterium]
MAQPEARKINDSDRNLIAQSIAASYLSLEISPLSPLSRWLSGEMPTLRAQLGITESLFAGLFIFPEKQGTNRGALLLQLQIEWMCLLAFGDCLRTKAGMWADLLPTIGERRHTLHLGQFAFLSKRKTSCCKRNSKDDCEPAKPISRAHSFGSSMNTSDFREDYMIGLICQQANPFAIVSLRPIVTNLTLNKEIHSQTEDAADGSISKSNQSIQAQRFPKKNSIRSVLVKDLCFERFR